MKSRIVFPIAIILWMSLACQISSQPTADNNIPLTEYQEAVSQPTDTPLPTEASQGDSSVIPDVEMVLVPAGEFTMGTNDKVEAGDAQPAHQVYVDAFYIDVYEVTNALYKTCVDAGACEPPHDAASEFLSDQYGISSYDNFPVMSVDWEQAQTFCQWRGGSLPTEAQWEKAARGDDSRTYPWGEGLDCSKANYDDFNHCQYHGITEVGRFESGKSPYGIYDLAGNLQEWIADWYDESYYANSPISNPTGAGSGQYRVVRGGSGFSHEYFVKSFVRGRIDPNLFFVDVGFRCVRPVSQ